MGAFADKMSTTRRSKVRQLRKNVLVTSVGVVSLTKKNVYSSVKMSKAGRKKIENVKYATLLGDAVPAKPVAAMFPSI